MPPKSAHSTNISRTRRYRRDSVVICTVGPTFRRVRWPAASSTMSMKRDAEAIAMFGLGLTAPASGPFVIGDRLTEHTTVDRNDRSRRVEPSIIALASRKSQLSMNAAVRLGRNRSPNIGSGHAFRSPNGGNPRPDRVAPRDLHCAELDQHRVHPGPQQGDRCPLSRHGQVWSDPVFIRLSDYDIGFLAGASKSEVMMLVLTAAPSPNSSTASQS